MGRKDNQNGAGSVFDKIISDRTMLLNEVNQLKAKDPLYYLEPMTLGCMGAFYLYHKAV